MEIYPFAQIAQLLIAVVPLVGAVVSFIKASSDSKSPPQKKSANDEISKIPISTIPTGNIGMLTLPPKETDVRLADIKEMLASETKKSRWFGYSDTLLQVGQYIIGGVLATSFIQESLSKNFIGVLGVLVLVSSLIRHHFRPDIHGRAATERVRLLKRLRRETEDNVFSLGENGALSVREIRAKVSQELSRIESAELDGVVKVEDQLKEGADNKIK